MMQHLVGDIFVESSTAKLVDRTDEFGVGVKRLIIEGIGIICDVPGINNRSYSQPIIEREMNRLMKEMVSRGRLAAELNHPRLDANGDAKDYPIFEMNLEKVCALIEEMHMEGNKLMVRMVVLEETPAGKTLAGLIRGGYHPGFSLRGAGSTVTVGDHEEISDDYTMITIDVVGNPSYGQAAIFNSRTESVAPAKESVAPAKRKGLTESVGASRKPLLESIERVMGRYGRAIARDYGKLEIAYGLYNKNALISVLRQGV